MSEQAQPEHRNAERDIQTRLHRRLRYQCRVPEHSPGWSRLPWPALQLLSGALGEGHLEAQALRPEAKARAGISRLADAQGSGCETGQHVCRSRASKSCAQSLDQSGNLLDGADPASPALAHPLSTLTDDMKPMSSGNLWNDSNLVGRQCRNHWKLQESPRSPGCTGLMTA